MRSKRLLTLLLVLCMMANCIAPVAAVTAGNESYGIEAAPEAETNKKNEVASKLENGMLLEESGKLEISEQAGVDTLRDNIDYVISNESTGNTESQGEGKWIITPSDKDVSVTMPEAKVPASVLELRELSDTYDENQVVRAFVVMKEEPLAETYSSPVEVPKELEKLQAEFQENVITRIEKEILNGGELNVLHQFTYLINAFSVNIEFGKLEEIACLDGVESVFLMPTFDICETEDGLQNVAAPLTESAKDVTGVSKVWETLGLTGSGMTIAIIDTGLDMDHPSFAAAPADPSMDAADIAAVLENLNAYAYAEYAGLNLTAEDLYVSAKVPFAFNYVDFNLDATHDNDGQGDHGTHVAGIAAANAVDGVGVVGMAPDAQLVIMKVFGANGGAYMDDVACALEDAMILGVDVINASLGSSAGFSQSGYEMLDEIYANLKNSGMIVNMSAGNDGTSAYGNLWGTNLNTTENPDTAAVGSPSTWANVNSIASADNAMLRAGCITVNGVNYMYSEALGLNAAFSSLSDLGELEYVMVPGLGEVADFEGLDLTGKIAVVARGTINFSTKLANAEAAGAIGLIVTNNEPGSVASFGMQMAGDDGSLPEGVSGDVPAVLVSLATAEAMAALETKVLTVPAEPQLVLDEGGGQMSSFSSWGVSPDLRLLPDMTGIGGNVLSCYDDGKYGYMSGTSMSSPQVAGMSALVVEYLTEKMGITDPITMRNMVNALMMSTADVIIDTDSGVEASPRQQGAGLVNVLNALTSEAYLSVTNTANNNRPKVELGDDPQKTGVYEFTFNIHNFSDASKTYALDASILTEAPARLTSTLYAMYEQDTALAGSVTFGGEAGEDGTVTVAAGATVEVTVTIALDAGSKAALDACFPNGSYVEGYVYLTNADEEGVDLHLPYLGFYGDWTQAPVFDSAFWYENGMWDVPSTTGLPDGNQYYNILWTDLAGTSWVLGMNPYSGAYVDASGNVVYNPANNVISPNGDGVVDYIDDMYISLMRNAKVLIFTYTDEEGNVLYDTGIYNVRKTMMLPGYGQIIPFVYSWYLDNYDFTDAEGNPLPSGTKLNLTITGKLDYEGANTTQTMVFPLVVDTNGPTVDSEITVSSDENGNYLTLTASDESSIAAAFLMNPSGTQILDYVYDNEITLNDDGTYSVTLDVTGAGTELMVVLGDYGGNESAYDVTFSADDLPNGNLPEMDTDALYAYRVYDAGIYDDSLYGWITIDKTTAATTQLTNDQNEYYALTAAEYVDGYIFAVDAGQNFLVMQPGLFYRNVILNLGVSVLDMTFNKADNTMYVSTKAPKEDYGYTYTVSTLDLLTGELTTVAESDSAYDLPYAMAATDDGVIYAIKYYKSGLFIFDPADGSMAPVLDAEGNELVLKRANGKNVTPYYSQSMTYDSDDGVIYWAFFTYTSDAELFAITPETEDAAVSYTAVEFPVDAECVGLLTLDEDPDYTLPEADALSQLLLSDEQLIMQVGDETQVTAAALPWNYTPAEEITWTSGNESVVTVSAEGVVTAVAPGATSVTASCEGVSASVAVIVADVKGTVYTYDYYNGNGDFGDWLSIDLGTMTYEHMYATPVDFIAADYNGHDGNIYGYDMNGQFYRFNPETGVCDALGAPVSSVPVDMAYDYATGFMYAMTIDQNAWTSTICYVNMNTGALVEVAIGGDIYMTLACDTSNGLLFAISAEGILYNLQIVPADGGGVMPLSEAVTASEETMMIMPNYIMEGLGGLNYAQSMCWDHNNGVILWTNPESTAMYWIDVYQGYVVNLGDPSNSGLIEYIGMYTIPAEIPELPYVEVEEVSAEDMLILVGGSKAAAVSINPLNATNQAVTYTSSDESVATVDASGLITGVSEGTATITGTLVDGENTYTFTFTVTVKQSAGDIYGYIAADMYTGGGQAWAVFPDSDPTNGIAYLAGCDYMLYSEEYVNGKLYAYGYDAYDWEANFLFMVIDPETFEIESMTDMGDGFPFVYDMTFDYTTGTMYAVAGYNDSSSDLYMVNMENGELISVMNTEPFFTSIAADENGTLYGMAASEYYFDYLTYTEGYTNAILYTFDVASGTYTQLFDTGVQCNMLASLAYDYDSGNLYWSQMYRASYWDPVVSGLYLIDLQEQAAYNLGPIGPAGSQVTGMYILADAYPAIPEYLINATLTEQVVEMAEGQTHAMETFVQPYGLDAAFTWVSSDESVATVDESGVVTAVSDGVATITVTVTDGESTFVDHCGIIVYGEDDYFLSYNRTEGAFAKVSRSDTTQVELFASEGDEIRSMALVGDAIYGYDVNNKFFVTSAEDNFVRSYLGAAELELAADSEAYEYYFEVRDLAWDAANERLLAVICKSVYDVEYDANYELVDGCEIHEVNLATGELEFVCTVAMAEASVSNIYTLTVAEDGTVYVYSSYDDYVSKLDLETGYITQLTTLQSQGVYGDSDAAPMAMEYDPITGKIFMLFTQNGKYYQLVSFNPVSNQLSIVGYMGEVIYDEDAAKYNADVFSGLIIDAEHVHAWTPANVIAEPTCTEDGLLDHTCLICNKFSTDAIPATGHDFEDGFCTVCGEEEPLTVKASNVASTGKVRLTWNKVDGAVKYKVYRSTSRNSGFKLLTTVKGTAVVNTSAVAGEQYFYYVEAIGADGKVIEKSATVGRACDLERPELTLTNVESTGKNKITWNAVEGAVKYELYYSVDGENWDLLKTVTGTYVNHTSAEAGTRYYYKVRALAQREAANSAYSTVQNLTCDLARPVVTLKNVASTGKIKITWNAVSGAQKYEVYSSTDGENWNLLKTVTGTSLTHASAEADKLYYYKVKAIGSSSEADSAFSTVKTRYCDLARPTLTVTMNSKDKPYLSWNKVAGAVKYEVYVSVDDGETWILLKTMTGTRLTHASAEAGTTYSYRVRAIANNAGANSAYSTVKSATAG